MSEHSVALRHGLPASVTSGTLRHVKNARALPPSAWPSSCDSLLSAEDARTAAEQIAQWPGYAATPLIELPEASAAAKVSKVLYKNEAGRFGLGSFKALGGAYALCRLLQRHIANAHPHQPVSFGDIVAGRWSQLTRSITVATATDGNHGRSVAWGARLMGCRSVIFIHENVSQGRERALAQLGARVVRIAGNYDDSVRAAQQAADREGWHVVSDTSYAGYTQIPRDVMAGYAVIVHETLAALDSNTRLSHVFVQGGVGGLAAAVTATLWRRLGEHRPRIVVVEPLAAACLLESARAGRLTTVQGQLDTAMAGLAAGEPSLLAWPILEAGVADFLAITDEAALDVVRLLGRGALSKEPVVAGESATAGVAGLLRTAATPDLREALNLDDDSVVLCIGTEGATDPEIYARIAGSPAAADAAVREPLCC